MRLLLVASLLATGYTQEQCMDAGPEVDIAIPGWKDNAKCFELDYDLDCHIYEAKLHCPQKCKRCAGDCVDGTRNVELDGLGELFCESIAQSFGDCERENVRVYCPVTCGACIQDGAAPGAGNDPDCCANNAANILGNTDAINTVRDNLQGEEQARIEAVAALDERVVAIESNPASGGGAAGFDRLAGAIVATCDTTYMQIAEFDAAAIVAPFQVVCPNNCQPSENVWGTQPFTAGSSICAAAAIYGALEPYSADNEDTHITVVPWTPVRNDYNGVQRGPFSSSPSSAWEAGFLVAIECPVLSLNIDERPIGYFFRNINKPNFKQWINANEDRTEIRYFELNTGNYWRMQTKLVDFEADVCYSSGRVMGARIPCETKGDQGACLGTTVAGENGVCYWGRYRAHMLNENGQKVPNPKQRDDVTILRGCTSNSDDARASQCSAQSIIDCNKLRGDNAEPLCMWAECEDGSYYSHADGACAPLPSWAMECDGNPIQRHNESFEAWITKNPSAQVPMRLDMAQWGGAGDYWQQASLCTTQVDIACLEGALLECPGDQQVTTLAGDFRAQVDIRFPMAVMPGMEVTVLLDQYRNVPSTFSAAQVEPGTQVLLPMKALTEASTYIMRYEGRDYLDNLAISECYIEIRDNEAPTFTSCPTEDVILTLNAGSHQTTIQYNMPAATDNVDGEVDVTCRYDNGTPWGLVDYSYTVLTNRCTASDFSNNEAVCEFNIIIRDEEAPVWEGCNSNTRRVNMDFGRPFATVNWQNAIPRATDNAINEPHDLIVITTIRLPDGSEEQIDTNRAIYQFPAMRAEDGSVNGLSTVHFEACDNYQGPGQPNGNCAYCEFQVIVVDGTPPVLQCPETQFINIASTDEFGNVLPVTYSTPTCEDNYDETCTPEYDFVQPFPGAQLTGQGDRIERVGSYTVQWSATDSSDNWAECQFRVVLYEGCFTYKFEWNEWIRNDVAYVGLPCRGATSFAGGERGQRRPCENDALYLDLSPTESTDVGGRRYSVWENYFFDDSQEQQIHDYVEVDPSLFGKWKLEFHMRETHHPYRMNQFTFYGELEFNAYGLQEWVWYDPTHVTPFVPISDIRHTLKVTCADNILCPQVTPRTRSTEPVEISDAREREIGQRKNVPCANGYYGNSRFGDGINFCCEADEDHDPLDQDSDPPQWNVCRNNSGECLPCNRPTCNVFRENTCICEDCAEGYFLTSSGECAPMCQPSDIIDAYGSRCDHGTVSGFKLGEDVSNCFCECDEGWNVSDTCDTPEGICNDRIDGRVDAPQMGSLRTGIPEDERTSGSNVNVPCASGYSGNLEYTCRLGDENTAEWYYNGNTCAEYQCQIVVAQPGRSCNAACWALGDGMTCNAREMNETNDFVLFRNMVTSSELGDSCEQNAASGRAYAPFASEGHQTWCYWQDEEETQCNIPIDNENKRICQCCPGCLITGRDRRAQVHWDWIGSGNTFFEMLDTPNRALFCQNPAGFQYEPYNFSDAMYNTSCTETEEVQMPRLCEQTYQDEHWLVARRNQSCHQACDELFTDDQTYYECDQQRLNTVYTPLAMRNGAIKAGEECSRYPPVGNSEPWYPAIEAPNNCYYRYDATAESRCGTIPGNRQHRRLCACRRITP